MSGWGIPGWLRMNPPVSRWAVAPSPEGPMKTRQKSQSGYGRWANCSHVPFSLMSLFLGLGLGIKVCP